MTSTRHNSRDDRYLDAARANILAVGWRRTTLTDIARRAGVSRMTIYRRWPDMHSLLADLLVREWSGLIDEALVEVEESATRGAIVRGVTKTVGELRTNPVFVRILELDPELLLPYLLERRGRNQDLVLDLLSRAIARGQADGTVRTGDPAVLGRALLLALHGFVISRPIMADIPASDLDHELAALVDRYLHP